MIGTITSALALADAVGLTDWVGRTLGGDVGEKAAGKIVDVVKIATGAKSPEEALEQVKKDKQLALEVRDKILEQEHEITMAYFQDLKDARQMYSSSDHKMADYVAKKIIDFNLLYVAILVLVNVGVIVHVENPTISLAVGNIIGASISYLWQERQSVVCFFMGSSMGSKDKDRVKNITSSFTK